MNSYHVYFDARPGMSAEALEAQVHAFMVTQVGGNLASGYRLLRYMDKATFPELREFHLIVDYPSEADLRAAFFEMKKHYKHDPHAPLMRMVSNFSVSFSEDRPLRGNASGAPASQGSRAPGSG